MNDHDPDNRVLNFAGDLDHHGQPVPMSVDALLARTKKWPVSEQTPKDVANQLARSRKLFVDGYYTYENFIDAVIRSLQAVEAAMRLRFNAKKGDSFTQLIQRANREGLIDDHARDALDAGRRFRNSQIHATALAILPPSMAAGMIETSHKFVFDLFEQQTTHRSSAATVEPGDSTGPRQSPSSVPS